MNKRKKSVSLVLMIVSVLLITGCSTRYIIDSQKMRQDAIEQDSMLLKENKTVEFEKPLTLEDVIRIGLSNNLDLKVHEITAAIGDEKVFAAKLKMLPQLNAVIEISSKSENEITDSRNEITGDYNIATSYSDEKDKDTKSLKLSWNILDFGLSYIRSKQAAASAEIKKIEKARQAQILTMKLVSAYWKAVIAQSNLEEVKKAEEMMKSYKETLARLLELKKINPDTVADIEKKQVRLALTASELQGEAEEARIILANFMGLPITAKFAIKISSISDYVADLPDPFGMDASSLELVTFKNRSELFISDIELLMQQDESRRLLLSMFPALRFDFSMHHDSNKFLHDNSWTMAAANIALDILSMPGKITEYKTQDKNIALSKTKRLLITAGMTTQLYIALHRYGIEKKKATFRVSLDNIQNKIVTNGEIRQNAGELSEADMANRILEKIVTKLESDRALSSLVEAYAMLFVTMGLDYDQWKELDSAKKIGFFEQPREPEPKPEQVEPEQVEPELEPIFKKTEEVKEVDENSDYYEGKEIEAYGYNILIKKYIVNKYDTITEILNKTCKIPSHMVYNEFLDLFYKMNPNINEVDFSSNAPVLIPVIK